MTMRAPVKGKRMVWAAGFKRLTLAIVQDLLVQIIADYTLTPLGPPTVESGTHGIVVTQLLEEGQITVHKLDGDNMRVTVDLDGVTNTAALRSAVKGAFDLVNETVIEDDTNL